MIYIDIYRGPIGLEGRGGGSRLPEAVLQTGQEPGTTSRQAAVLVVLTKACVVCQDPGGFTNQLLGTLGTTYKKNVENLWFP